MEATQNRTEDTSRGAIRCDMCGATFPNPAALRSHQARVHQDEMTSQSGEPKNRPTSPQMSERSPGDRSTPDRPEQPERDAEMGNSGEEQKSDASDEGSEAGDGDEGEPGSREGAPDADTPRRAGKKPAKESSQAV
jgi:hypothetical protein